MIFVIFKVIVNSNFNPFIYTIAMIPIILKYTVINNE